LKTGVPSSKFIKTPIIYSEKYREGTSEKNLACSEKSLKTSVKICLNDKIVV